MRKLMGRIVAGGAALIAIPALALVTALPSQAETRGTSVTVRHGDYKAVFHHTGSKGETLEVFDYASDGYAAVAYVTFYSYPAPPVGWADKDKLVVDDGYHRFNLREGDSGSYDVPEGHGVRIMICRGVKEIPGDNCSPSKLGRA
ncbi:hypothetical protein [Microlunatus parietis]|uniref:DUF1850 domain-containing protein n=1 Tax=Microlunatus parietis TaxID=682979 RepID=A0A7Y9I629_9ACTN|nr:hypothetical protein [Microlunatus parietis]NYE70957.1 hypothetical protein [Microlunatus parietis]